MGRGLFLQAEEQPWIIWSWLFTHVQLFIDAIQQHLLLTLIAVGIGLAIELPLALPAIFAGVRIATVSTIGLITITAVIGLGGLGQLIYEGLIDDFRTPLLMGTLLSILLALVADLTLAGVQRLAVPWART